MQKKPLNFPLIKQHSINEDIYLVTLASEFEITEGRYIEYQGYKISSDSKEVPLLWRRKTNRDTERK